MADARRKHDLDGAATVAWVVARCHGNSPDMADFHPYRERQKGSNITPVLLRSVAKLLNAEIIDETA